MLLVARPDIAHAHYKMLRDFPLKPTFITSFIILFSMCARRLSVTNTI